MPQASLLSFFASSPAGGAASLPAQTARGNFPDSSSSQVAKRISLADQKAFPGVSALIGESGRPEKSGQSVEDYPKNRSIVNAVREAESLSDKEDNRFLSPDITSPSGHDHLLPPPTTLPTTVFTLPNCPSVTITSVHANHLESLARLTASLLPIRYPWSFYSDITPDSTAALFSRVALYRPTDEPSSDPIPIGWIRCSLEPSPSPSQVVSLSDTISSNAISDKSTNSSRSSSSSNESGGPKPKIQIYIKALCLHPSYRNLGIATALLDSLLHHDQHDDPQTRKNDSQPQKQPQNSTQITGTERSPVVDLQNQHQHQHQQAKTISLSAHVWIENADGLDWYEKRGFRKVEFVDGYYRKLRPAAAWIVRREV